MKRASLAFLIFTACVQTTGGQLVEFTATASGASDAVKGEPYHFGTPSGFDVTLIKAQLFIGAVYLNQSNPANYTAQTACILPGIYSGEVKGSLLVDALDPAAQPFPVKGLGTDSPTLAAELWLTAGDVNDSQDATVILSLAGTARKKSLSYPFTADFTIGPNRQIPSNPALPGSNPICKQRIVSPIAAPLTLSNGGTLRVQLKPKTWFNAVDFAQLAESTDTPGTYVFFDGISSLQPDVALYNALRTSSGPYEVTFTP